MASLCYPFLVPRAGNGHGTAQFCIARDKKLVAMTQQHDLTAGHLTYICHTSNTALLHLFPQGDFPALCGKVNSIFPSTQNIFVFNEARQFVAVTKRAANEREEGTGIR